MYSSFFGVVAAGFLSIGAYAHSAQQVGTAGFATEAPAMTERAAAAELTIIAPPADLEDDDSGDYMKLMTPAQLEKLYAEHDAEVGRLMAAAPDEPLVEDASLVDPLTGEKVSIDLVAF